MQGGDALEVPAVDIEVKANGNVFQHSVVALRPQATDVEGDSTSGRVRLRGCALASSQNDRSSYVLGVAMSDAGAGENVKVRVQGCVDVRTLGSAVALGDTLHLSTAGCLAKPPASSTDNTLATQGFRVLAWALEAGTPSGSNATDASTFKVCFNGLGWGQDDYSEQ